MKFNNRTDFIQAAASEKITLAFVYPAQKLVVWEDLGADLWKKSVNFIVDSVKKGNTYLTQAANAGAVNSTNQYFYNILTNEITLYSTSTSPDEDKVIVFYKLCFSNAPIKVPHNLQLDGEKVEFEARIQSAPAFKSVLNTESVSLVNGGTLSLENNDGYFDSLYLSLVWESKLVEIYSHNRSLDITEAKIIYRGYTEDRSFTDVDFNLSVRDIQNQLEERLPMTSYNSTDEVAEVYFDNYKRIIYGKAKGVECRSISQSSVARFFNTVPYRYNRGSVTQVEDDYIVNVISAADWVISDNIPLPEYTDIPEISKIYYLGIEYTRSEKEKKYFNASGVELPTGTTTIYWTRNGVTYSFNDCYAIGTIEIVPDLKSLVTKIGYNRTFSVCGHQLAEPIATILVQSRLNQFTVNDASNFEVGDRVEINGNEYFIKYISGNLVRTTFNSITGTNVGFTMKRKSILNVYVRGVQLPNSFIINQGFIGSNYQVEISRLTELYNSSSSPMSPPITGPDIALTTSSGSEGILTLDMSFYLGVIEGGVIAGVTDQEFLDFCNNYVKGIEDFFKVGDIISTSSTDLTKFSEISNFVKDGIYWEIKVRPLSFEVGWTFDVPFPAGPTYKQPFFKINDINPLEDSELIVVDCYGKTIDGISTSKIIKTGSDIIKDLIQNSSKLVDYINLDSFEQASLDADYSLSLVLPLEIENKTRPKIKEVINLINKSIKGSLYLNQDLNVSYKILNVVREPEQFIINDDDVINWSIKSKSGELYTDILVKYDHRDYNVEKKQKDTLIYNHSSDFVRDFEISGKTLDADIYVRDENQVQELAERILFGKSLTENVVKIKAAYSLIDLEIGQQVVLELRKLYRNPQNQNRILGIITSMKRDGDSVEIEVSDLGNLFNRVGVIAHDTGVDWDTDNIAVREDSSYITDENGLINDDPNTDGLNIIG